MNKTELLNKIVFYGNRTGLVLKKHSPVIFAVAGSIGVVVSAVMACKATTKVSEISTEFKASMDDIHTLAEQIKESPDEENGVTEDSLKKATAMVYIKSGMKYAKLYAPAVGLGILSLSSLLVANGILHKRNMAIAAAYTAVDKSFKEYRNRVIDKFGKEVDRELRFNLKEKTVETTVVNDDGQEETVTSTVVVPESDHSAYARFFDESCAGWEKDSEYNLMFLRHQQNYANDLLKAKGHLFLNEVYDLLDIQRTRAGQVVGWIYDEKNPVGDNYVDFGIYDLNNERKRAFVNGHERNILLDFNVDGNILDLI